MPDDPRIKDFVGAVKAHLDDDVVEPYYLVINDHTTLYECSRCGAAVPYRAMNRPTSTYEPRATEQPPWPSTTCV